MASGLSCGYLTITLIAHITFGIVMIVYTSALIPNDLITSDAMHETIRDWDRIPFTSIQFQQSNLSCPIGTEDILYRAWYGTDLGCDCINGYSKDLPYPSSDHSMLRGRACTWTEHNTGCETIPPLPLRKMTPFPLNKTCATRGGTSFLEAIRPDAKTLECPGATFPCSQTTTS